ncbi:hypothetical protein QO200_05230 [Flavobacterium sp. Arc3]|uniref:hypothetical protein n=1 Tax=Flavobacterium sp. Arc3 TaxID=3046686 RepID=UPI00352CC432
MKHYYLHYSFLFLLFTNFAFAQEQKQIQFKEQYTKHNKGKFFISWGGNREVYSKSDVTFTGKDYNFTLDNLKAHDKPKGWNIDYINPSRMTIPQTNFRLGYFLNDHYSIAIGLDHMKYVMTQNQTVNITGTIDANTPFDNVYNNTPIVTTEDFLKYEHTDGLNYIHLEVSRNDDISSLFGINNTDKVQINLTGGAGAGVLYPKTNTTLLGKLRHDDFHVSGYGMSLKQGLNITFFKHFYIQGELKEGYINMQDIRTTQSPDDKASQSFFFLERLINFGVIFKV